KRSPQAEGGQDPANGAFRHLFGLSAAWVSPRCELAYGRATTTAISKWMNRSAAVPSQRSCDLRRLWVLILLVPPKQCRPPAPGRMLPSSDCASFAGDLRPARPECRHASAAGVWGRRPHVPPVWRMDCATILSALPPQPTSI